ncbi:MAG: DUF488 domain-containing protein [Halobacteriaceae archaeon]
MTGNLDDTYVAALQHDRFEGEGTLVGVVRRPNRLLNAAVAENYPALGPPDDLLDEFHDRREDFKMQGLCEEGAHNAAWDALDFEARYRDHLESGAAADALSDLGARLDGGEDLVLVCYENTDRKRCHRTVLGDALENQND